MLGSYLDNNPTFWSSCLRRFLIQVVEARDTQIMSRLFSWNYSNKLDIIWLSSRSNSNKFSRFVIINCKLHINLQSSQISWLVNLWTALIYDYISHLCSKNMILCIIYDIVFQSEVSWNKQFKYMYLHVLVLVLTQTC